MTRVAKVGIPVFRNKSRVTIDTFNPAGNSDLPKDWKRISFSTEDNCMDVVIERDEEDDSCIEMGLENGYWYKGDLEEIINVLTAVKNTL